MQEINNYSGYWKFSEKVPLEDIKALALEWAKNENYLSLHIRKASKDQYCIGFEYADPNGNTQKTFADYQEATSDSLRRQFGNGLVGWDYGSWYYNVK